MSLERPGRGSAGGLGRLGLLVAIGMGACGPLVSAADREFGEPEAPRRVDPYAVARATIDSRDVERRLDFLSSNALGGRAAGSPELERAAAWLAERLHEIGLIPAGQDGGYLQFWPMQSADSLIHVPNVVAALPGSDVARAQQHVVITAHFDHAGRSAPDEDGDSIYNGANDNASGVAALMAVAEAFAALPVRPARPVLFLLTSGGEHGSAGGAWFAENAPIFLSNATAVIALERVGGRAPESIALVGYGYSDLGPLVERLAAGAGDPALRVRPHPGDGLFRAGGHFPLVTHGLPGLLLTTSPDSTTPRLSDHADLVDPRWVVRVARLAFVAAHELASRDAKPEWTPDGRSAVGR